MNNEHRPYGVQQVRGCFNVRKYEKERLSGMNSTLGFFQIKKLRKNWAKPVPAAAVIPVV
jgi:hypothetical protein